MCKQETSSTKSWHDYVAFAKLIIRKLKKHEAHMHGSKMIELKASHKL